MLLSEQLIKINSGFECKRLDLLKFNDAKFQESCLSVRLMENEWASSGACPEECFTGMVLYVACQAGFQSWRNMQAGILLQPADFRGLQSGGEHRLGVGFCLGWSTDH